MEFEFLPFRNSEGRELGTVRVPSSPSGLIFETIIVHNRVFQFDYTHSTYIEIFVTQIVSYNIPNMADFEEFHKINPDVKTVPVEITSY